MGKAAKSFIPAIAGAAIGYGLGGVSGALLGGGAGALLGGASQAQAAPTPAPAAPAPVTPPPPPVIESKPQPLPQPAAPAPAAPAYTPPPPPQVSAPAPVIQGDTSQPVISNPAVQAARDDTRRRAIASEGQQSTILTGEMGEENDPLVRKNRARGRIKNLLGGS